MPRSLYRGAAKVRLAPGAQERSWRESSIPDAHRPNPTAFVAEVRRGSPTHDPVHPARFLRRLLINPPFATQALGRTTHASSATRPLPRHPRRRSPDRLWRQRLSGRGSGRNAAIGGDHRRHDAQVRLRRHGERRIMMNALTRPGVFACAALFARMASAGRLRVADHALPAGELRDRRGPGCIPARSVCAGIEVSRRNSAATRLVDTTDPDTGVTTALATDRSAHAHMVDGRW